SAPAGCPHCSLRADGFNGIGVHLEQRDVMMVAVSRAPYSKLAAYQQRMGWNFKWVSSSDTDFNFDYHVSFTPEEFRNKNAINNFGVPKKEVGQIAAPSLLDWRGFGETAPRRCFEPHAARTAGSSVRVERDVCRAGSWQRGR